MTISSFTVQVIAGRRPCSQDQTRPKTSEPGAARCAAPLMLLACDEARWWLVSLPVRIATLLVAFLAVVAGGWFIVVHYLLGGPPVENFTAGVRPTTGAWVHTTLFEVPAGSRVNMTILGYDGCTPLRNPYWSKVTGTVGNVI